MRALRTGAAAIGALAALTGCWRYRAVPTGCSTETAGSSTFDVTAVRTAQNELHGRVVGSDSATPIANASVDYPTTGQQGVLTAADGRFALPADSLGVYTVRARRVGFTQALGRVRVRADSGGPLHVVMHRTTLVLDGCGYVQLRVARPWWQWWFPPRDG